MNKSGRNFLLSLCALSFLLLAACTRMNRNAPADGLTAPAESVAAPSVSADKAEMSCEDMRATAGQCAGCTRGCDSCKSCKGCDKCPCCKGDPSSCGKKDCQCEHCKCQQGKSCSDMKAACQSGCPRTK